MKKIKKVLYICLIFVIFIFGFIYGRIHMRNNLTDDLIQGMEAHTDYHFMESYKQGREEAEIDLGKGIFDRLVVSRCELSLEECFGSGRELILSSAEIELWSLVSTDGETYLGLKTKNDNSYYNLAFK